MANLADLDALLEDEPTPKPVKAKAGPDLADLDAMLDEPPAAPAKSRMMPLPEPEETPDLSRPAGAMGRTIPRAIPRIEPPVAALEPIPPEANQPYIGYQRGGAKPAWELAGPPKPVEATITPLPEPGIVKGVVDAFRRGYRTGNKTADLAIGQALGYDPSVVGERLRENTRLENQLPRPESVEAGLQEISQAEGPWGAAKAIVTNPRSVLHVAAESAGGQVPQMLMQAAGATAGPVGLVGTTFAGSASTEFASSLLDEITDQWTKKYGRPPASGSDFSSALRDPEIMAAAKTKAAIRAPIVGGFDALTAGLAGRWLKVLERTKATPGQWAGAAAKELGMQGAGGAAGEFAAQTPTEDKYKWGDIGLEFAAELPTAPVEAHGNVRAYQETRPDVQLAKALSGEPVIDPAALPIMRQQQALQQIIARANQDASQQAPIPPGATGPAPANAGEPAPAVPPAGGQLGGDTGIAGAIGGLGGIDPRPAGAALYGQQHVPTPYDDPAAALRGSAPDPSGIAGILAGQPTGPAGVEPSPWEGEPAPWELPPAPEQPWQTRGAEEEGVAPTEDETARLGELDGLLEGEPEAAAAPAPAKPFGYDPEQAAGKRTTAEPEEDIEATIRRKRGEEEAEYQRRNAQFEADEVNIHGAPETELEHAEARLRRAQHDQQMSNRFGIPPSWEANARVRAAQEGVAAALKAQREGPTSRLRPGTPDYVARLREGFQPRVPQRDITRYRGDIRRGEKFGTDNPILSLLERDPLDVAEAADYGADFGRIKGAKINRKGKKIAGTTGTGHDKYFGEGGRSIDKLAEELWEHGYITEAQMGDQRVIHDIVNKALNAGAKGAGPQPVYSHGYMEAQGKAQQDAEFAANALDEIDRVDAAMVEIVYELADADPEAFDGMLQVLADNAGDEDKSRQAIRGHYNQYYADQQAAVAARGGATGAGGADTAGQAVARPGPEPTGNQGSDEEGLGNAPGEEDYESGNYGVYNTPDDWLMQPAEAEEYKAIRRIPYDQRTQEQHDRFDELDDDYQTYRRETLFTDPEATVNAGMKDGETKSQAEADAQLEAWKATARAQRGNSGKTVLSIFDATGQWSQPWYDAGYNVITLDIKNGQDLMEITSVEHIESLTGGEIVDVVLAAIPCTDFAASGARWWYEKDRDGVTKGSIELAQRALAVIEYLQPDVWAAENPVGRIQKLTRLPDPQLIFQPNDYGDPYTKRTLLYGKFDPDLPLNRVEPTEGSRMHKLSSADQDARSITPEGFAYAFFMQNGGEGYGPVTENVTHAAATQAQETPGEAEPAAGRAAPAEEPDGAAAAAPAVGEEADTGVAGEGLESYTPEELKARDERIRRLERERIKAEQEAERKAKADEEADEFTLTGSDRPADSDPNQGAMFDVVPGATKAQLSRMPPGTGFGKGFEAQAITQRPSRHLDAWAALGLTDAQGANLPIHQAIAKLKGLYVRDFGFKEVKIADNAHPVETRDSMLDGYRGISDMMYRLALPLTAVSLNGTLTLQFEPFSKKNAYYGAYNPGTRVIHMPGRYNSFGHEWMHALDHQVTDLAGRDGNTEGLYSLVVGAKGIGNPASELQTAFAGLMNSMFFDQGDQAWKVLQLQVKAAATDKNGKQTVAAREAQAKLEKMTGGVLAANAKEGVQPTAYSMSALNFQPGSNYWINAAEMMARAYEAYLANQRPPDMLNEFIGKTETAYLDNADKRLAETFPKLDDRSRIFNAFDDFFAALRNAHELGTGPAAERPEGEGVFDPSKWGKYPDNETRWQRTVEGQLNAFRQWQIPTMRDVKSAVKSRVGPVNHFWHATFLANRSNLDLIAKKNNNAAPLLAINDLLYTNRGSGRTQAQTLDEAIVTRSHSRNNELAQIMRLTGLKKLTPDENRLLRAILVSGEQMLGNEDVAKELGRIDVSKISGERIDKIEKLAAELRKYLDKEWYYNTRNGIELAYTRNGYMPRVLNYAKVYDNLDHFELQARKTYGALFDRDVGTDPDELNMDEFARSLREVRHTASQELIGYAKQLRSLNAKIRYQERALLTSDDPDAVQDKLRELYAERQDLLAEMLPVLRRDWSKQAALQWRTHMATGELTEYDTMGPAVSYTRGRTLPAEADVLMADFYNPDVLDALATYTERSSRRVEYATRFGVKSEKLDALLEEAAMRYKVHRNDIDQIKGIVNEATGRERHGVPQRAQDGLNAISSWMTLYMLGRATFASVSESMAAGVRTRNFGDYFRGFGSIVHDVFGTEDAQARQALAEALGLIAEPYHDALMGNRLAGDSLTREASLRAARYFEYIGLGALTRAQVRSTLPIATAYLRTLGRKAIAGHQPSRQELQEFGIPVGRQKEFTEWLTTKVESPQPTPADLMDRYTDEFHEFGQYFAVAAKRFSSQVIMEPTKMDKPKLATHPAARFLWGIQSFNMALWHNITKPLVLQIFRDADTLARGQARGRNAGRNRFEAATNLATAGIAIGMIFQGQLLSTIVRAALLDWEKWQEKDRKGELGSWLAELAFWRMGAAGLFDPLVQAVRGIKWQRDITGLTAGAQYSALLQNIQDMLAPFTGRNSPNTNTAERKAAKAVWNTAGGPLIAWATAASPLGPLVGPLMGLVNVYAGSGQAQEGVANIVVGKPDSPNAKKAAKAASGEYDPKAELKAERKRQRAEQKAAAAAD
ncbi:MAG: LPD1 domain-containing protein [Burkholderiaceae bacterium]